MRCVYGFNTVVLVMRCPMFLFRETRFRVGLAFSTLSLSIELISIARYTEVFSCNDASNRTLFLRVKAKAKKERKKKRTHKINSNVLETPILSANAKATFDRWDPLSMLHELHILSLWTYKQQSKTKVYTCAMLAGVKKTAAGGAA